MAYKKGQSGNPAGRPKGSTNKATSKARDIITQLVEGQAERILADIDELKPVERVKVWLQLLEYTTPKLTRQEMQIEEVAKDEGYNYDNLTEDELESLLVLLQKARVQTVK